MSLLKKIFSFYINSSIHVALAVLAFVGVTAFEFDFTVSNYLMLFVFFGTITGYNFVKYAKVAGLHHRSLTTNLRSIQLFSILSAVLFGYATFYISLQAILVSIILGVATLLYAVPFFATINLRAIRGLKIFIVAIVWAGVTVILPMVDAWQQLITDGWLIFGQRVLLVIVLILPFEIRDVDYDAISLRTFPQRFGIRKTKGIGVMFLTFIMLLEGFKDEVSEAHIYSLLVTLLVLGILLLQSKTKQSKYFASFLVESIPIVYLILLLLFSHFLS